MVIAALRVLFAAVGLSLFHPENMDGALDRHILHGTTVAKYPNQPDLVDMTRAAIDVLSRHPNGFVLMASAGLTWFSSMTGAR